MVHSEIAEQVVQQRGDYSLAIKGNQATTLQDLNDLWAGRDGVGFAAERLALLRRLALMLLRREISVRVGLQAKRLRAGWHDDYLLKILNA